MHAPSGYDPITLNHWLWYKYQCHECSPAEFQRLFENIMKRARPEFVQIRPYGSIGDRKCDGLFFVAGVIFQVYSPDEMQQAKVISKIDEDLDLAVQHWQDILTGWTFVYNVRRGLPPDIPQMLYTKREQYPNVKIDHLSSDGLWELARGLTLQQRAEILGAPSGYEHLFLAPDATNEQIREALEHSRFVLIQDTMSPINLRDVVYALQPDQPFGAPVFVRPSVGELPWNEAAEYQQHIVMDVLARSQQVSLPRFAVFSLAQIPLAIHLGFLLSDRVDVTCYQYDRDHGTWRWPERPHDEQFTPIEVTGLPAGAIFETTEVIIRVSLSAKILSRDTEPYGGASPLEIDITADKPDVTWLQSSIQLTELGQVFRRVLSSIRSHVPQCTKIHLFYAGPTAGAIALGRQVNPRMNPPIDLYEFSYHTSPRYRYALTIA